MFDPFWCTFNIHWSLCLYIHLFASDYVFFMWINLLSFYFILFFLPKNFSYFCKWYSWCSHIAELHYLLKPSSHTSGLHWWTFYKDLGSPLCWRNCRMTGDHSHVLLGLSSVTGILVGYNRGDWKDDEHCHSNGTYVICTGSASRKCNRKRSEV